jgi:tRNA-dihydrouridine synthase 4
MIGNRRKSPLQIIHDPDIPFVKVCAPMVRYSKLPFRHVVRNYNVDIAFTPMILADVFKHSKFSREIEYQTNDSDDPVIIQFASANAKDFADSAELVAPFTNGVDLNCG